MTAQQEYIIEKLTESGETSLTESLYMALVEALARRFKIPKPKARLTVINTLRVLYAQ